MENLFTRGEIITFKIIGWIITLAVGCIPIWLFYKSKKETKKLEKRLEKEIIARKDSENKIAEENAKRWSSLYQQEKEIKEKHCGWVAELKKELRDLRD